MKEISVYFYSVTLCPQFIIPPKRKRVSFSPLFTYPNLDENLIALTSYFL